MRRNVVGWVGLGSLCVLAIAWRGSIGAQEPATPPPPPGDRSRFTFEIVESFDAQYLGDTPGHKGRGSLGRRDPDIALNDSVYHGDVKIGRVTQLIWNRAKESLELEFDPEPLERITVGMEAWVPMGGAKPGAAAKAVRR